MRVSRQFKVLSKTQHYTRISAPSVEFETFIFGERLIKSIGRSELTTRTARKSHWRHARACEEETLAGSGSKYAAGLFASSECAVETYVLYRMTPASRNKEKENLCVDLFGAGGRLATFASLALGGGPTSSRYRNAISPDWPTGCIPTPGAAHLSTLKKRRGCCTGDRCSHT